MLKTKDPIFSDFIKALANNKVPERGSELAKKLKSNPQSLTGEFGYDECAHESVVASAISGRSLKLADFILKNEDDAELVENADPFYCGNQATTIDRLPASAGVNVYLALCAFQYYPLEDLIEVDKKGNFIQCKKTYYNCLHWRDEAGKKHPALMEPDENYDSDAIFMYEQKITPWFMKIAYDIFLLSSKLKKEMHRTYLFRNDREIKNLHAQLGHIYFRVALIEDHHTCSSVFGDFLDKALQHYEQSSLDLSCQNKLKIYKDEEFREQKFSEQMTKCNSTLYSKETRTYREKTLGDWIKSFNEAQIQQFELFQDIEASIASRSSSNDTTSESNSDGRHSFDNPRESKNVETTIVTNNPLTHFLNTTFIPEGATKFPKYKTS